MAQVTNSTQLYKLLANYSYNDLLKKEIVVIDVNFLCSDEKQNDITEVKKKYEEMLVSYHVIFVDSGKFNTLSNEKSKMPIYKL